MLDLTIDHWSDLSSTEAEALARRLARELPGGFEFARVRHYRLGSRERLVALFRYDGAAFVLLPGGDVGLGYDVERPWQPEPDERESWENSAREHDIQESLDEFIAHLTRRPCTRTLQPVLMEVEPRELGWEPVPADDPVVRQALKHGSAGQVTLCQGDQETRVTVGEDGTVTAHRAVERTHAELAQELAAAGFRFPTADEWEHACGAGAATLFRWGDHVPCDRYPTDISPDEAAWRRQWVYSEGTLQPPPAGFEPDWDLHLQPSACGVAIARNPYNFELTADPRVTRGGDGGCMICGGHGFFIAWLTLATAYFADEFCTRDPDEPIMPGYTIGRRVLELGG